MVKKISKINKKFTWLHMLFLAGAGLFLIIFIIVINKFAITSTALQIYPDWKMEIVDKGECVEIEVVNRGYYIGSVEDYVATVMGIGLSTSAINQSNTYKRSFNVNSKSIIAVGPQGVANINTIFLKSETDDIYMVSVHDIRGENFAPEDAAEETKCADFAPQLENIVKQLI